MVAPVTHEIVDKHEDRAIFIAGRPLRVSGGLLPSTGLAASSALTACRYEVVLHHTVAPMRAQGRNTGVAAVGIARRMKDQGSQPAQPSKRTCEREGQAGECCSPCAAAAVEWEVKWAGRWRLSRRADDSAVTLDRMLSGPEPIC